LNHFAGIIVILHKRIIISYLMASSSKISLEQNQTQRLIPLQVRVGRLLEMNSLELEQEVKRALEELPALDVADNQQEDHPERSGDNANEEFNETAEQIQLADYAPDDIPVFGHSRGMQESWSNFAAEPEQTLAEVLSAQVKELDFGEVDSEIAKYIIGSIDSNGYMTRTVAAIAQDIAIQTGIDVEPGQVRSVWQAIRTLDPPGIGAVDLRDALLLQLRRKEYSEAVSDATEIVSDYFDLFSLKHYSKIQAQTGMSRERLQQAVSLIRMLNPKPGSILSSSPLEENFRHIIPDFKVDVEDGRLTLSLLNDIPSLTIEKTFSDDSSLVSSASPRGKKEALAFLKIRRDEAKEFISLLHTRQQTLFRVMSAIVALQKDFFLTEDLSAIHPMILKDVAAMTGDDISVVSRTTANKYVATARGVYPLKIFFNERTKIGGDPDSASSREVANMLKEIIDSEDKTSPLPDEAIVELLKKRNLDIARRTVAKYRERLGIPVARLRKEI